MLRFLILLLPSFVCLFWFITLLCRRRTNYLSQNILAVYMLVTGISFYFYACYFAGYKEFSFYYRHDIVFTYGILIIYPLNYLYFKSLTNEKPLQWTDYLWLVPAFIIGTGTAVLYALMGEQNAAVYARYVVEGQQATILQIPLYRLHYIISVRIFNLVVLLQAIWTTVYSIISLIRYRNRLKEFYSNMEGKSMGNNYGMLAGFILSILFSLITALAGRANLTMYPSLTIPLFVGWGTVFYFLAYNGYTLKYTAADLGKALAQADAVEQEYICSGEESSPDEANKVIDDLSGKKKLDPELVIRFSHLIDVDKIYLQNDLRLDDVARMLRTNRTYISRLLNEEYQNSFSDFINCRRIEYAKILMRSDSDLTQEAIASRSGFLHVSSFSRTFKRFTGMAPREWLKSGL